MNIDIQDIRYRKTTSSMPKIGNGGLYINVSMEFEILLLSNTIITDKNIDCAISKIRLVYENNYMPHAGILLQLLGISCM